MKYATHRGYRIAYDVEGDGPPVVLQHGLLDNRKRWAEVGYVAGLADSYRVICVDSLGHGDSDKPKEEALYQREQRAGDIAAVLARLHRWAGWRTPHPTCPAWPGRLQSEHLHSRPNYRGGRGGLGMGKGDGGGGGGLGGEGGK